MDWKLQIANYRCFADDGPLSIDLTKRSIAFIGPNNSGKSAALRFFWELGPMLARAPQALLDALARRDTSASVNQDTKDLADNYAIFTELNDRNMKIDYVQDVENSINFIEQKKANPNLSPIKIRMEVDRNGGHGLVGFVHKGKFYKDLPTSLQFSGEQNIFMFRLSGEDEWYYYDRSIDLYPFTVPTYIPANRSYGRVQIADPYDLTLGAAVIDAWGASKASTRL